MADLRRERLEVVPGEELPPEEQLERQHAERPDVNLVVVGRDLRGALPGVLLRRLPEADHLRGHKFLYGKKGVLERHQAWAKAAQRGRGRPGLQAPLRPPSRSLRRAALPPARHAEAQGVRSHLQPPRHRTSVPTRLTGVSRNESIARPKSHSFTSPLTSTSTFSGLRSCSRGESGCAVRLCALVCVVLISCRRRRQNGERGERDSDRAYPVDDAPIVEVLDGEKQREDHLGADDGLRDLALGVGCAEIAEVAAGGKLLDEED